MATRRQLLQAAAAAGAAGLIAQLTSPAQALAGPARLLAGTPKSPAPPVDVFSSSSNFAPLLGSRFKVALGPRRSGEVKLVEVKDAPVPSAKPGRAPGPSFSLLFDGAGIPGFSQGTYTVTHASLGAFAMFLSPVGQKGRRIEAVINRRTS